MYDYFRGFEADQFTFLMCPDMLLGTVSNDALIVYGLLLRRLSLSIKNEWKDEDGKIFIFYKQEDISAKIKKSLRKVTDIMKELETAGLIVRKKQGMGYPTKIFVMNFARPKTNGETPKTPIKSNDSQTRKICVSGDADIACADAQNLRANNIESNNTETHSPSVRSRTDKETDGRSREEIENDVADQIDANILSEEFCPEIAEACVAIISDAEQGITQVRIGGKFVPPNIVRKAYQRLRFYDCEAVCEALTHVKSIKNPVAYLAVALYNGKLDNGVKYHVC